MNTTATATATVLDRLIQSGITEERARHHLASGWVRIDDTVVTDPSRPADPPAHVEIRIIGE
ncbi:MULTISPECIES: hypothetical protein [unclassified Pseudonocardia]|jgi:hypothetical protein|uniref:hypothetical protein n=1 Tax=unclassified Pseudonocardia TaxID=2619320 RepID=UPI000966B3CB|nr:MULTISPECIES: hypothetical protein [unclassified Pseudonocardia]MBN9100970.1 hypothetical protein [Pseudonocardia sp.]OJY39377.1 MAG: hypothetical protein BGP03_06140 [Pseudonocardia sp. 73-21]